MFDDQHVFTLILIVVHQPFAKTSGELVITVAGNRSCQCFSERNDGRDAAINAPARSQKSVVRIKHHAEVIAIEIKASTGGFISAIALTGRSNCKSVALANTTFFFEFGLSDGMCRCSNQFQPFTLCGQMRFTFDLRGNLPLSVLHHKEIVQEVSRRLRILQKRMFARQVQAQRCRAADAQPQ